MNKNILICGVGGQGSVLASKLIARAAMQTGACVRTAETIGMAQRGGSVVSHVRIGPSHSPLIPHGAADLILALEPAEAVRSLIFLKPGGAVVTSVKAIKPVSGSLHGSAYDVREMLAFLASKARLFTVDTDAICRAAGSARSANVAMLGAAAATGALGLTLEEIEAALRAHGGKFLRANQTALRLGAQAIAKGEHAT
jgi:indolepyruvate ferredoxin oxidoreductase beta subunit